jgi:hypothetical protein
LEQSNGSLLADARHARNVVRWVACQRFVVHNLRGGQSVLLLYGVSIEDFQFRNAALRGAHAHMGINQLQLVAVACEDERVVAVFDGIAGERAHQVIRLEALLAERRDAHRL